MIELHIMYIYFFINLLIFFLTGIAVNSDWIESFIFLLIAMVVLGCFWMMSSWYNLFGLILLLVYSGGIAILLFFFFFLYGRFLYEGLLWIYMLKKFGSWFNMSNNLLLFCISFELIFLNTYIYNPVYFQFFHEYLIYVDQTLINSFDNIIVMNSCLNLNKDYIKVFNNYIIDIIVNDNIVSDHFNLKNKIGLIYTYRDGIFTLLIGFGLFLGVLSIVTLLNFEKTWVQTEWNKVCSFNSKYSNLWWQLRKK